jgi:hypothetical protein
MDRPIPGARFFTNNHSFQVNHTLSQDPLVTFAVHCSHNIGDQMYASIGLHYDIGGESYVDGIPQHDQANGFRPALSISRAIWSSELPCATKTRRRRRVPHLRTRYYRSGCPARCTHFDLTQSPR